MRLATLIAPTLVALAIGACGTNDAADAEATVSSAIKGIAAGDAGKVCAKLTPAAKDKVVVVLRHNPIGRDIKAKTCEEALTKLHASLTQAQKNVLVDGEVGDAKVKGDKATVHVVGAGMEVELQKQDDRWLITGGFL
jgi:2',3'-cyclic-nucleotide 2'-phosphodiesterase (5'-nucleotidase family)